MYYYDYKNAKVGDVFWEKHLRFTVTSPVEVTETMITDKKRKQYRWKAVCDNSFHETDYLITEGYEHYGPEVYTTQMYVIPDKKT